jgi:large subunit ribosomal protein L35
VNEREHPWFRSPGPVGLHLQANPPKRPASDCVGWLKGLPGRYANGLPKETKMPKLKTKSGVKKRFKFTASGKVKHGVAGKRHRLISHNSKYIRTNRGTSVLSDSDVAHVRLWAPYGLK